ncbi:MAG: hypothetical protein AB7P99_05455 [Vicinamibacterales bacterium]
MIAAALLAWCLVLAVSALLDARQRPTDPMARLDAEFRGFAPYLPPSGTVGYLDPVGGWMEDAVRTHYAAQYALAPRIIVTRLDQQFLIVAAGAADPAGDPRLDGFVEAARFASGHRLFRRFP